MPQTNKLNVKVYPITEPTTSLDFDGVNYISFISSAGGQGEGTYGIPAIITENKYKAEGLPLRVLYVNPHNVAAMDVTRTA
jgi:hypothetical protein